MSMLRKRPSCAAEMFNTNEIFYGLVTIVGDLLLTGDAKIGGGLDVTGSTGLGGFLEVAGATQLDSTLNVTGPTTLATTLKVEGVSTLEGATTVDNTLDVTGAATMGSTLGVTGAATLSSTLGVTGATTLSSTLAVTGNTTLSSLTAGGAVTHNATTVHTGATTMNGRVDVYDTHVVHGSAEVRYPTLLDPITFYIQPSILGSWYFTSVGCVTGLPFIGLPSITFAEADAVPAGDGSGPGSIYYDDGSNTLTGTGAFRMFDATTIRDTAYHEDPFLDTTVQSTAPTVKNGRIYVDDGSNTSTGNYTIRVSNASAFKDVVLQEDAITAESFQLSGGDPVVIEDHTLKFMEGTSTEIATIRRSDGFTPGVGSSADDLYQATQGAFIFQSDSNNNNNSAFYPLQVKNRTDGDAMAKTLMTLHITAGGNASLQIPTNASDGGSASGFVYMNSSTGQFKFHNGTAWQAALTEPAVTDFSGSIDPQIGGVSIAGATVEAHYTLVGRIVTYWFSFLWSTDTNGDAGQLTIRLPFTASNYQTLPANFIYNRISLTAGYDHIGFTNSSGTVANFYQYGSTSDRTPLRGTQTAAGTDQKYIFGTMTYLKAA